MATSKIHRSMGSCKMADGFQSKVVAPRNPKLVREAEESITVSTCCGQVGPALRLESPPVSLLCLPLLLSSSTVKPDTTSPPLCCHASVGGGYHGAVGDGLCASSGKVQNLAWMCHWSQVKRMYWALHWNS